MKKDAYLSAVNAVFVLGASDKDTNQPRDASHVPGEFFGAYMSGYDLSAVKSLILPCIMQTSSAGYDDGMKKATKKPPTIVVGDTVCQVNVNAEYVQHINDDFRIVYSDAYVTGLTEANTNPPPGPVGPVGPIGPTGPGPTGPGPIVPALAVPATASDNTLLVLGSLGAVAVALGAGYMLFRGKAGPAGFRRRAVAANPSDVRLKSVSHSTEPTTRQDLVKIHASLMRKVREYEDLSREHDWEGDNYYERKAEETYSDAADIQDILDLEQNPIRKHKNPAKDINPGHVWLQGVGWAPGKPAGQLRIGDRMMWNYGYVSTVEQVEQVSPQFVSVKERLEDGKLYDRRMKVDRLVAIARS